MWENLVSMDVSVGNLVLRAIVVYFSVLILLRSGGKRQIGQMGPTEFVAVLLISNAVQNAMNAGDNSLLGGVILAITLVGLSWLISFATFKFKSVEVFFEGSPTILVHQGKVIQKNMDKEQVSTQELHSRMRRQGITAMNQIATAILEANGDLTLIRAGHPPDLDNP